MVTDKPDPGRTGSSQTRRIVSGVVAGVLALALLAACERSGLPEPDALPALGAKLDQTTTSGISSGAYMAGQFQVAHSRIVIGAAIIAGGPYGCAESVFADVAIGPAIAVLNVARAINGCMLNGLRAWGIPDAGRLAERARNLADTDAIDPIEAVRSDRVYLYSGVRDSTVVAPIVKAAADFYRELGVAAEAISLTSDGAGGHAFITADAGLACGENGSPHLNDCDFDQAGVLLTHLRGPLAPKTNSPDGRFIEFDQTEFTSGLENLGQDPGMAAAGMAYVPKSCAQAAGCAIHIAYHGCSQNREKVGKAFIEGAGFAQWADSNRLIVLFPEIRVATINPYGCWDWWGYSGRGYLTRTAPQIMAVMGMLERLASQPK